MKKIPLIGILIFTLFVPLCALDFGFGFAAVPGLAYNGLVDPAFTGAGVSADVRVPFRAFFFRAGIEAEVSGIGVQLLSPIGVESPPLEAGPCALSAYVSVIPGLAMFKPRPLFMYGAEIGGCFSWFWAEHWGLDIRIGARYISCPEYSARVSRYETVDLPLTAAIRYRI